MWGEVSLQYVLSPGVGAALSRAAGQPVEGRELTQARQLDGREPS